MPAADESSCSASVSTFANTMPAWVCEAASNTGAKLRQGPHHDAQKSTSTMPGPDTVSSKRSIPSSTVAMGEATTGPRRLVPGAHPGRAPGVSRQPRKDSYTPSGTEMWCDTRDEPGQNHTLFG